MGCNQTLCDSFSGFFDFKINTVVNKISNLVATEGLCRPIIPPKCLPSAVLSDFKLISCSDLNDIIQAAPTKAVVWIQYQHGF